MKKENSFQALMQIRSKIAGMDRGMASNLIAGLGVSPEMIRLLTMTNAQFKAMAGDDMIISEKNRRRFVETRQELTKLKQEFTAFAMNVLGEMIPFTRDLVSSLSEWKGALEAIGIMAVAVAFDLYPITASITTLFLLMQDFYAWKHNTQDSLFGEVFGDYDKDKDNMIARGPVNYAIEALIQKCMSLGAKQPSLAAVAGIGQVVSVVQYILGSGSAEAIADAVKEKFDGSVDHAAAQINNW